MSVEKERRDFAPCLCRIPERFVVAMLAICRISLHAMSRERRTGYIASLRRRFQQKNSAEIQSEKNNLETDLEGSGVT